MLKKKFGEIEWLEFTSLQPFPQVKHGVFVKSNGCMKQDVEKRATICKTFGISHLPLCRQVHKDGVVHVDKQVSGCIGEYDASITQQRGVGLPILHADCQAAIFFDPKTNTIANVHSGWRGSVLNIYQKTVEQLVTLGVNPKDLIVCISPSLGPENAEFINYQTELPESFIPFQKEPTFFDFWELSKQQLQECGVKKDSIEVARLCTYEHSSMFYSYRRGKDAERNMTLIALIS